MQNECLSSLATPIGRTIEFQKLNAEYLRRNRKTIAGLAKSSRVVPETLGERANLHPTYIGGIERGERNPSLVNMAKLAQAFGISLSELVLALPEKGADIGGRPTIPNEGEEKALAVMSYLVAQTAFKLLHARRDPGARRNSVAALIRPSKS